MPMRNSKLTDEWIAAVLARNPYSVLPNGNLRTGPVRLCFVNLVAPAKPRADDSPDKKPSYNCVALFPPGSEAGINSVLWPALYKIAQKDFPANIGADGSLFGLNPTFLNQGDKQNYAGFTPGCMYTSVSSTVKPPIVDTMMNPIIDPARVYSGVWAILALNAYASGKGQPKKGPRLGIQSVMLIADDERLDGAVAGDPNKDFAGVQIDAQYNPAAAFGTTPQTSIPAAPPPGSVLPPPQHVYAPPANPGQWQPPAPAPAYARPPLNAGDVI